MELLGSRSREDRFHPLAIWQSVRLTILQGTQLPTMKRPMRMDHRFASVGGRRARSAAKTSPGGTNRSVERIYRSRSPRASLRAELKLRSKRNTAKSKKGLRVAPIETRKTGISSRIKPPEAMISKGNWIPIEPTRNLLRTHRRRIWSLRTRASRSSRSISH